MKNWSKLFQNEEYLEMTRIYTLNKDTVGMVVDKIGIKPGMRVLDVASGSGEFVYYLSRGVENVEFTGLDYDSHFVEVANRIKDGRLFNGNAADFIQGDATDLPFESNSFDLVVSHTFFNSIPNYMGALKEMKRVCKYEGRIATIATMDVNCMIDAPGVYPKDLSWKQRYDELLGKVHSMYEKIAPMKDYVGGIQTRYIPYLFSQAELKEVSAYPIGNFISLSNAAMPKEDKERYIRLQYLSEEKRLMAFCEEAGEEVRAYISEDEIREFLSAAKKRMEYLLGNINTGENSIWEWSGFADLLVVGSKPSQDEYVMSLFSQGL